MRWRSPAARAGRALPVDRLLPALAWLAIGACVDPVRAEQIAALGPEARGVAPGPLHRPGQPCLVCHDADGGESGRFSVAGTIYLDADGRVGVNDATVRLVDSNGTTAGARTNCAGNFWIDADAFAPRYPIRISVVVDGRAVDMESRVFREGSCAACHGDPKSPTSAGHVYVLDDPAAPRPAARHFCP